MNKDKFFVVVVVIVVVVVVMLLRRRHPTRPLHGRKKADGRGQVVVHKAHIVVLVVVGRSIGIIIVTATTDTTQNILYICFQVGQ